MADRTANLIIRLKDAASDGLKGLKGTLDGLKSSWLAVTAVVTGAVAVAYSAVKAYSESQDAIKRLESALASQGMEVANNSRMAQELALQLEHVTGVSDEVILKAQAMLTTFGMSGQAMRDATKAALDLSARFGIDLTSAAIAVGKASQGQTMQLERLVGKIAEGTPVTQKYAEVMKLVEQRAGGAAEAMGETFSGRVNILKERMNDLQETVGKLLLPAFEMALRFASYMVDKIETLSDAFANGQNAWVTFGMVMLEGSKTLLDNFIATFDPIFGLLQKLGLDMDSVTAQINAAIDRQIGKLNQKVAAHQAAVQKQVTTEKTAVLNQSAWMEQELAKETKAKDDFYAGIKARTDKHFEDEMNARIKSAQFEEEYNKQKAADWATTLSTISSLSTAHNKTLAAVGKAAAIADATISTLQGIGKAWALGPFIGPPMAALVAAAGFANVAKISGVQLAEGGIVMPRPGGTTATIGEAGSPEAVIPLDDERAQGMLGGGGEMHVHFHGPVIADKMSIREFARTLDKEFFSLQKNRISVSGV